MNWEPSAAMRRAINHERQARSLVQSINALKAKAARVKNTRRGHRIVTNVRRGVTKQSQKQAPMNKLVALYVMSQLQDARARQEYWEHKLHNLKSKQAHRARKTAQQNELLAAIKSLDLGGSRGTRPQTNRRTKRGNNNSNSNSGNNRRNMPRTPSPPPAAPPRKPPPPPPPPPASGSAAQPPRPAPRRNPNAAPAQLSLQNRLLAELKARQAAMRAAGKFNNGNRRNA